VRAGGQDASDQDEGRDQAQAAAWEVEVAT